MATGVCFAGQASFRVTTNQVAVRQVEGGKGSGGEGEPGNGDVPRAGGTPASTEANEQLLRLVTLYSTLTPYQADATCWCGRVEAARLRNRLMTEARLATRSGSGAAQSLASRPLGLLTDGVRAFIHCLNLRRYLCDGGERSVKDN